MQEIMGWKQWEGVCVCLNMPTCEVPIFGTSVGKQSAILLYPVDFLYCTVQELKSLLLKILSFL